VLRKQGEKGGIVRLLDRFYQPDVAARGAEVGDREKE
jgi:hypothetical protein